MLPIEISPGHLTFKTPLTEDETSSIKITNQSPNDDMVFKIMTTAPDYYFATPNIGMLHKNSSIEVTIKMVGLINEPVRNFHCNDKMLVMVLPLPIDYVIVDIEPDLHKVWDILQEETQHQGVTKKININYEIKEWKTTWDDEDDLVEKNELKSKYQQEQKELNNKPILPLEGQIDSPLLNKILIGFTCFFVFLALITD